MEWYGFVLINGKPNISMLISNLLSYLNTLVKKPATVNGDDVVIACLQEDKRDLTNKTSWVTGTKLWIISKFYFS